ncbi:hypothetical protein [Actinocorallia sp. A-T 12471]|uniref:hypothetical protein n=1 Tax=Actinocorallia sp. A-T 12471 TaxID=3089813 RepID=UPI0029CF02FF|nr:hypothetical protein [Actinocorallia sp. A-T 12471]MDX6738574.1 hypothetical protein [Actinocorallia sp. A-T 12471]
MLVNIVLPYDDRRAESFRALEGVEVGQEIVATGTCEIFAERTNALVLKGSEIVG